MIQTKKTSSKKNKIKLDNTINLYFKNKNRLKYKKNSFFINKVVLHNRVKISGKMFIKQHRLKPKAYFNYKFKTGSKFHNRCFSCYQTRSFKSKFGLCRICVRESFRNCDVSGVKYSSV